MKYLTTLETGHSWEGTEWVGDGYYPCTYNFIVYCDLYTDEDTQTSLKAEFSHKEYLPEDWMLDSMITVLLPDGSHETLGGDGDTEIILNRPIAGNVEFILGASAMGEKFAPDMSETITFTRPDTYEFIDRINAVMEPGGDGEYSGQVDARICIHKSGKYGWYEFSQSLCPEKTATGETLAINATLELGGTTVFTNVSYYTPVDVTVSYNKPILGYQYAVISGTIYGDSDGTSYYSGNRTVLLKIPINNSTVFIKNSNGNWNMGELIFIKDSNNIWRQAETIQRNI